MRKSGSRILVTAQLINTSTDAHIWSERYERELTDVFEIQDDISSSILKELNIHFAGLPDKHKPTTNTEAYSAYLLGRYQFERMQLEEAVASFEKGMLLGGSCGKHLYHI